ncbi:MAG: deoxyribose-phosphate aldolase, partial [Bacteroidia bacterium]|nr:deoxyribose-phosphate aldolase [Bacteroidia bacterium]
NKIAKVIIETAYLTKEEIEKACRMCVESDADFVKTSTGFASRGASIEDIEIMRKVLPTKIKIKAAGGIRDRKTAEDFIKAGADRIGTSAGVAIVGTTDEAALNA